MILVQEEKYEQALLLFYQAQEQDAFDPHCMYNIGLCQYMLKEYGIALKCTCDIIARGVINYPGSFQTFIPIRIQCCQL